MDFDSFNFEIGHFNFSGPSIAFVENAPISLSTCDKVQQA